MVCYRRDCLRYSVARRGSLQRLRDGCASHCPTLGRALRSFRAYFGYAVVGLLFASGYPRHTFLFAECVR
jgi:hypothetical protein